MAPPSSYRWGGEIVGRKAVGVERERLELILAPQQLGLSVAEVCQRFGMSRTQFYVWRRRYHSEGVDGLSDLSSRPKSSPHKTPPAMELSICRMRVAHPKWGARRIRAEIIRAGGDPPAKSTIGRILVRNGLITPTPRKRIQWVRFERPRPNDLWQIDGRQVTLADGSVVWVVNVLDDHARYLLASRAAIHLDGALAWEAFVAASEGYGLPRELLSTTADILPVGAWDLSPTSNASCGHWASRRSHRAPATPRPTASSSVSTGPRVSGSRNMAQ